MLRNDNNEFSSLLYLLATSPVDTIIIPIEVENELAKKPIHAVIQPANAHLPVPYLRITGAHTTPVLFEYMLIKRYSF